MLAEYDPEPDGLPGLTVLVAPDVRYRVVMLPKLWDGLGAVIDHDEETIWVEAISPMATVTEAIAQAREAWRTADAE